MRRIPKKTLLLKPELLLVVASTLFITFYGAVAITKYLALGYNALDLAIFNQVFFNTLHGDWLASSIHPPSYVGDHFSPIIFLLLPVYAAAPHPLTLIALQITALTASAWLIYIIAAPRLGRNWAIAMAVAWLANPFVGNVALFEFSTLAFAGLSTLIAYHGYEKKQFPLFLSGLVVMLLCREDLVLGVLMFTILALIDRRQKHWWLTPAALAVSYTIISSGIINIVAPGGHYKFLVYYAWLGDTPSTIMRTLISQPWRVLAMLLRPGNLIFSIVALLPVAFIPLIAPRLLILAIAAALQFMLGSAGASLTVLQTQYAALFLVPIYLATIDGLAVIQAKQNNLIQKHRGLGYVLFVTVVVYTALALGPVLASIKTTTNVNDKKMIDEWRLIKSIPTDAAVAATYDFLAPLSARKKLVSFNYIFLGRQQFLQQPYTLPTSTDYLLLDFQDLITYQLQYGLTPFYQKRYEQSLARWPEVLEGFAPVAAAGSTILYQRAAPAQLTTGQVLPQAPDTIDQPAEIALTDDLTYLGANRSADHIKLFWRADLPLKTPYRLKIRRPNGPNQYWPLAYDVLFGGRDQQQAIIQMNIWSVPTDDWSFQVVTIDRGGIDVDGIGGTVATVDHEQTLGPIITVQP